MWAAVAKPSKVSDVAERSPTVISANLKEEILLEKQMHVLSRSEKNVVHRIKVDQKVMYRQFQSRLIRSKLAMARIMGNKTLEKDLRSKNLGGLHTDVVAEEDYAFLAKLEHRPCTSTRYTPNYRGNSQERTQHKINMKQMTEPILITNKSQVSSSKRLRSAPGNLVRSLTTTCLPNEGVKDEPIENSKIICNKRSPTQLSKNFAKTQNNESDSNTEARSLIIPKQRPKTVTIVTNTPDTTPLPSPRQYSRRTSRAADFFEEDKKIDMVELRLRAARALDFSDKVQHFCGQLEEMASGQPQTDWYSSRLHSQEPIKKNIGLPEVIEDLDNRHVGNLYVRSMTVPQLDFNFD